MASRWIITALGQDRPGIVASVTQILYQLGCNLEDSAMTRLEGEFAILLIFSSSGQLTEEKLRRAFRTLERHQKLTLSIKVLAAQETRVPAKRGRAYVISVYGADRPGIVFRVSSALVKQKINIIDVQTHRTQDAASKTRKSILYIMLLEVEIPKRVSISSLERRLKALGKSLGVAVSLRAAEAQVL